MPGVLTRLRKLLPEIAALLVVTSLICFGGWACGAPSFDAATQQDLDAAVEKVLADNVLPGAVVGVWVPEKGSWVVAKGEADTETGRTMQTSDKFRIASITKTFTATMVLLLADEGRLALDDTLDTYLPQIPFASEVTIRQLLNHTAGIIDDDDNIDNVVAIDPLKEWTPLEVVKAYTEGELAYEPGTEIHYSNTGYIILGMVIEAASGDTVASVLEEEIAGPLGLANTYFAEGPDIEGEYAHGYNGDQDVSRMNMSWDWTAGAMISTLDDLKIWAKALAEGTLLSEEMHQAQLTFVDFPAGEGGLKYGLGIYYDFGFLGHSGANIGYQADMMYYPQENATIVILFNKLSDDESDLDATEKAFVGIVEELFPGAIPDWYREVFKE